MIPNCPEDRKKRSFTPMCYLFTASFLDLLFLNGRKVGKKEGIKRGTTLGRYRRLEAWTIVRDGGMMSYKYAETASDAWILSRYIKSTQVSVQYTKVFSTRDNLRPFGFPL